MHVRPTNRGITYLYCYKRGQGVAKDCQQKATDLAVFETQIEQYLSQIKLPSEYQRYVLEAYEWEDSEGPGFEKMRQSLLTRLARLKEMYEWGDVTPDEYRARRDQLRHELAALPPDVSDRKAELERLAAYLENVGSAWHDATQEQRNRLAHTLFETIRVEDRTIKGITPQIEFTPLLLLNHLNRLNRLDQIGEEQRAKKEVGTSSEVSTQFSPAEATGFEPAVSALTGLHVRPLHHASIWVPHILPQPRSECQVQPPFLRAPSRLQKSSPAPTSRHTAPA